ncbi:MAG TPA: hypothetical protein VHX44_14455 [Planctomycetota bacterium]|jgi:hypothetical protein|nr:hypothetical protein [Planctomycetota bacterium]
MTRTSAYLGLILLVVIGRAAAVDVPLNRFYPNEAVLVPLTERDKLQLRLDQYGAIRLEPGNYSANNPLTKIILKDGQRIYGLSNNLPEIEVEPGTTGAVVSYVHCTVTFPVTTSTAVTGQNLFRNVT